MTAEAEVGNSGPARQMAVVPDEDRGDPDGSADREIRPGRERRRAIPINCSPLARKIITFNLAALIFLIAGVLFLNPLRVSLIHQRESALIADAELVAGVFEARLANARGLAVADVRRTLVDLDLRDGIGVHVFDALARPIASSPGEQREEAGAQRPPGRDGGRDGRSTIITDFLGGMWTLLSSLLSPLPGAGAGAADVVRNLAGEALGNGTRIHTWRIAGGQTGFVVATQIRKDGRTVGVVSLSSAEGEIDELVRQKREQVLRVFVIAILVSVGLSLLLASTIANPLADLAAAAEIGHDRNARKMSPGRVRIPDLTARPDVIGRLSGALRGMIAALYDRIDANEQFAADVAHEIKNPLASLRSAVGTLRVARKPEHRRKLLDVIDHDVRRLDRLVSDISNASRLDSELVKEEEEPFDLLRMVGKLADHLGEEAARGGIEFIIDLPAEPIIIHGLEPRLAQVLVNLISNGISFCESGDAIRVWTRRRENRVLVVVEDTGPGIPDQALHKIFKRFYSERPEGQFGNNSGLGLAISKQIVEAHGGVIWAENIRPTDADIASEPLGARFVIGLPI